jgi:dihydropteroate synthase
MDVFYKKRSLRLRGALYDLSQPLVMGILNYTPDSFYDGGKHSDQSAIVAHVERMITEGADIIDVGAVSSRPGSLPVSEDQEIRRLSRVMGIIRKNYPDIVISLDTFRSAVARKITAEFGADMINDISCGTLDEKMLETVAILQVPYIAMHMQGTPLTMQQNPVYEEVLNDILKYFATRVQLMRSIGIHDIVIDPGFGFGKNLDHNYELAGRLEAFNILGLPLLVGFSRKSMICKLLKVSPEHALSGTIILNTIALMKGADILRVHDVKEAREAVKIAVRIREVKSGGESPGIGGHFGRMV